MKSLVLAVFIFSTVIVITTPALAEKCTAQTLKDEGCSVRIPTHKLIFLNFKIPDGNKLSIKIQNPECQIELKRPKSKTSVSLSTETLETQTGEYEIITRDQCVLHFQLMGSSETTVDIFLAELRNSPQ